MEGTHGEVSRRGRVVWGCFGGIDSSGGGGETWLLTGLGDVIAGRHLPHHFHIGRRARVFVSGLR